MVAGDERLHRYVRPPPAYATVIHPTDGSPHRTGVGPGTGIRVPRQPSERLASFARTLPGAKEGVMSKRTVKDALKEHLARPEAPETARAFFDEVSKTAPADADAAIH